MSEITLVVLIMLVMMAFPLRSFVEHVEDGSNLPNRGFGWIDTG